MVQNGIKEGKIGYVLTDNVRLMNLQIGDLVECYTIDIFKKQVEELNVSKSPDFLNVNGNYKSKNQRILIVKNVGTISYEYNRLFKTNSFVVIDEFDIVPKNDFFFVDENGLLVKRIGRQRTEKVETVEYEYDEKEHLVKEIFNPEKLNPIICEREYNEKGKETKILSCFPYSNVPYFTYERNISIEELHSGRCEPDGNIATITTTFKDDTLKKKISRNISRKFFNTDVDFLYENGKWIGYKVKNESFKTSKTHHESVIKTFLEDGYEIDIKRSKKDYTIKVTNNYI